LASSEDPKYNFRISWTSILRLPLSCFFRVSPSSFAHCLNIFSSLGFISAHFLFLRVSHSSNPLFLIICEFELTILIVLGGESKKRRVFLSFDHLCSSPFLNVLFLLHILDDSWPIRTSNERLTFCTFAFFFLNCQSKLERQFFGYQTKNF